MAQHKATIQPNAWTEIKTALSLADGEYTIQVNNYGGIAYYVKKSGAAPAASDVGSLILNPTIYDLTIDSSETVYLRSAVNDPLLVILETDD